MTSLQNDNKSYKFKVLKNVQKAALLKLKAFEMLLGWVWQSLIIIWAFEVHLGVGLTSWSRKGTFRLTLDWEGFLGRWNSLEVKMLKDPLEAFKGKCDTEPFGENNLMIETVFLSHQLHSLTMTNWCHCNFQKRWKYLEMDYKGNFFSQKLDTGSAGA